MGVIVRTKDRPYFLARALGDIAAQSLNDVEVVVVNDRGDREQVAVTVAASRIADRVRIVDVSEPGGRCFAANAGIRATEAPYVVLHDDDDLWHPDFLARTVEYLDAHPRHVAVSATTEILYEEARGTAWVEVGRAPFWASMHRVSLANMLEVNRVVPISFLYRRAVHDDVGWYDESLEAVEDWDLYLRVLSTGEIGFLAGEPLAFWTQRPAASGSAANSMFELADEHARDDAVVRDRELAAWMHREGVGLPLYLARLHREMIDHTDRQLQALRADVREDIRREIDSHQPVWSRLRRLRLLLRRR